MADLPNNEPGTPPEGTQNGGMKTEKTFTQEELDAIVQERLSRAKKDMPSAEELKAYRDWQESQKTEQEKYNDRIKKLEENYQNSELTNKKLSAQLIVAESSVKKEFVKFVTNEVMEMVDDNTDVKTALSKYQKENPQYFGEVFIKKTQTSSKLGGDGSQGTTTNDIMNNILRGSRNSVE